MRNLERTHAPRRLFACPGLGIASLLALSLSSCGSGGSGGDGCGSGICLGFTSSGSSFAEGTSATITIELQTSNGPLADDLTLNLVDSGTGTATVGLDYLALPTTGVTFSAGSADMDTIVVPLSLLDDSLVEGIDETIELSLNASIEGVTVSVGTHTLTILDGDQASIEFSQVLVTTPDEGDATYTASVALSLDGGDSLGTGVSVVVSDEGSGTATGGTDFNVFQDQTITFSAGSASGASVDVSLTVVDDALPEVDETVILELGAASPGVVLGTNVAFTLSITEDDTSPEAFLQVMGDDTPGGVLMPLTSGEMRDFGTQSLGSGPGANLRIQLTNAGQSDMALAPISLSGDIRDFRIQTQVSGASSLNGFGRNANFASSVDGPVPLGTANETAPVGTTFTFDALVAAALLEESAVILDGLIAPSGEVLTLALERRPLPVASDAELWVDGALVPGGFDDALVGVSIWSGSVLDKQDSEVFLALTPNRMEGWVQYEQAGERTLFHLVPAGDGDLVIVASDQDLAGLSPTGGSAPCMGAPLPDYRMVAPGMGGDPGTENVEVGVSLATCRLAIETDYHLFTLFADQNAVTAYVTELIAAVASAYERDVQAILEIAYLGVYTTPADPWSSGDNPGDDTIDLLDEFRAAWNASGWPAQADLAHFISGANLGGGVAYVGVLCSQVFGFGVSANINGNIDWGTFSGAASPITWDFVVVAHELGHNFGASHTQDYCPPLDLCTSNCTGNTSCGQSTLMSYCHLCGSGLSNIDLEFHPFNSDIIRDEIANSCLLDASLAPGATLAFDVSFEPVDSIGPKSAMIQFSHDATNQPSPFQLDLQGTAQN